MSENKNNAPGCNCCQDDHEAVVHNLQELVRNLDSCCNNRGTIIKNQKGEIDKLRESNRALHEENDKLKRKNEVVRGMQSKIAKQSNEIERLNEMLEDYASLVHDHQEATAALDRAAKDNFNHGYHRGMDELWAAIRYMQDKSPSACADICGFKYMNDFVANLSAQDFAKKVTEWKERRAKEIHVGDEVIHISPFGSDDSECFIVYSIEEKADGTIIYHSIGSGSSLSFSNEAIADGSVRKTGRRYDSIPFDYIG